MEQSRGMTGPAGMISIRLRYVCQDVDRHGNVRTYFWRKGHRKVRIREMLGTSEFLEVYQKLLAESEAATPKRNRSDTKPQPDTYRWLCVEYFRSSRFCQLDPRTQRVRQRVLELTCQEPLFQGASETFGDCPIARLTPKSVRVLRDRKAALPEAGNERVKLIRAMFTCAVEEEHAVANPARDVPLIKTGSTGFHSWTTEEVERFEEHHAIGTKARLAFALLLWTGVRRSDVVLLGKQHARGGWLKFAQQKNRNRTPVIIEIPILADLQRIIDASPTGDLTFLVSERNRPFSVAGFGNWFRTRCDEAGLSNCSAHGLRKAGATIAAENGASEHQLMSIFGWATSKEAERYTKAASRKKMAGDAMQLLQRSKSEQKFPTFGNKGGR
jgi:integrase